MSRPGYVGVSLPQSVMKEVDDFIDKDTHGYKSRAEFFKDAARRLLQNLNGGSGGNGGTHNSHLSTNQKGEDETNV